MPMKTPMIEIKKENQFVTVFVVLVTKKNCLFQLCF